MTTKPSKSRFSLLRFSLRFLLLIVFLAACVMGWLSWKIQCAKAELQLARELETPKNYIYWSHYKDGEDVWPEPGWNYNWLRNHLFSHVTVLHIWNWEITSLDSLKPFKHLTSLYLSCPVLVDVDALEQFPNLTEFHLFDCQYLEDLQPIGSLKKLETRCKSIILASSISNQ